MAWCIFLSVCPPTKFLLRFMQTVISSVILKHSGVVSLWPAIYLTSEWRLCPCFCLNPCVFSAQQMLLHICVSLFVKKKTVRVTNGGAYRVSLCYSMCLCLWMHTYGAGDIRVWACICILALQAFRAETWLITCLPRWMLKLKQNGHKHRWLHQIW